MTPHEIYINGLSEAIHNQCKAVGWWDDPDRCLYTCIQLVSTEVSEATEGVRKDLDDNHLPQWKMEEVEYADALIRVLDLGGFLNLVYNEEDAIVHSWCNATCSIGQQHLGLNSRILSFANAYRDTQLTDDEMYVEVLAHTYNDLIKSIIQVAMNRGYALWPALEDKMVYNGKRADHKRENRAGEHGKKF